MPFLPIDIDLKVDRWAITKGSELDADSEIGIDAVEISGIVAGYEFINDKHPTNMQLTIAFAEGKPYIKSNSSIHGYLSKVENNCICAGIGVKADSFSDIKEFLICSSQVPELYVTISLTIAGEDLEGLQSYERLKWPDNVEHLRIIEIKYSLIYDRHPFDMSDD